MFFGNNFAFHTPSPSLSGRVEKSKYNSALIEEYSPWISYKDQHFLAANDIPKTRQQLLPRTLALTEWEMSLVTAVTSKQVFLLPFSRAVRLKTCKARRQHST